MGKGYASYKIGSNVMNHHAYGVGVYSNFRDMDNLSLDNAIISPSSDNIKFSQAFTFWLDGMPNSQITHVINGQGDAATSSDKGPHYQD